MDVQGGCHASSPPSPIGYGWARAWAMGRMSKTDGPAIMFANSMFIDAFWASDSGVGGRVGFMESCVIVAQMPDLEPQILFYYRQSLVRSEVQSPGPDPGDFLVYCQICNPDLNPHIRIPNPMAGPYPAI